MSAPQLVGERQEDSECPRGLGQEDIALGVLRVVNPALRHNYCGIWTVLRSPLAWSAVWVQQPLCPQPLAFAAAGAGCRRQQVRPPGARGEGAQEHDEGGWGAQGSGYER